MKEPSIFTKKTLESFLEEKYALRSPKQLSSVIIGSNNIFIVISKGKKYLVKEIDSMYEKEHALFASRINNFIHESDIPTAEVLANIEGSLISLHNERSVQVQEYIEGDIFLDHECPQWLMDASAEYLAKINHVLDGWEDEDIPQDKRFLVDFDRENYIRKFTKLIAKAKKLPDDDIYKTQILVDLKFKLDVIKNFENIEVPMDIFTFKNTHGDYNSRQFLCGTNKIKAIIDWDRVSNMAAIVELFRSYYQEDPRTKDNSVNIDTLRRYIKHYIKYVPLGKEELEIMPFIHFKKLLRSSFGYKQYLNGGVRNVADYVTYGFWRTKTVKYLLENYAQIGNAIKDLGI